jgi:formate dehydrogenase subunit gamma
MTSPKKKRNLVLALVAAAIVAIGVISWEMPQPATAHPGYSCNPAPGHGDPGCHRSVTPTTKRTTTTTRPKATTTRPKATTTTKAPTTTTATVASSTTTATADLGATLTGAASTTVSEESTTSVTDPSTTTLAPPADDTGSTPVTNLADLISAIVAGNGGGGGPGGGWTALLIGLGALAGAGWALLISKWAGNRRTSGRRADAASGGPLRFVLAERLAHWVYVVCFLSAGVTGALMWIPATANRMAEAYFTIARLHGYIGLAMVFVPLLIILALDRRRLAENRRTLSQWSAHDRRWLRAALAGGLLRGKKMPPQGRFNAGQKVNSYLVLALTLAFVVTGSLLIARGHLPVWLASGVLLGHKVLAIAGATLVVGHVCMAVLTPHGRGGLKAMIRGVLPAHVAREGHALWYAEWLKHRRRQGAGLPLDDRPRRVAPVNSRWV